MTADLAEQVRGALAHLHDLSYLQTHPLTRLLTTKAAPAPQSARAANPGLALRSSLEEAVAALRPGTKTPETSHSWRGFEILRLRYLEGLEVRDVVKRLAIGRSEYYRDHVQAIEAVATLLCERWRIEERTEAEGGPADDATTKPTVGGVVEVARQLPPNNLPIPLTSFVGREKELAEVRRLLGRARLLTLTGTGGSGKTRLALQVASELLAESLGDFPDGVYLVELASLSDPALVPQTVAASLGLREVTGEPILTTLLAHLKPKGILLVLDNCEHLLDASARLANSLLTSCPRLHILATSREPLGMTGEVAWRVSSLSAPSPDSLPELPPGDAADWLAALSRYDSVRLFVERAADAKPEFSLSPRNAAVVAQLCHRLDGIPLALELAATRVTGLSVEQIVARLDQRFRLLTGGSRTALPRQQTLRATIDWSYDLLAESERALFRRLAVFAGGCTYEAVEAVYASEALEALLRLVDKSLVVAEADGEASRYRLPETIRQYAEERLTESGEAGAARGEHATYYLRLAEEAAPELLGPRQREWLDRLEADRDNLRSALRWFEEIGDAERGLKLADLIWQLWAQRGPYSETKARLQALLGLPKARETSLGVKALASLTFFTAITDGREVARPIADEGLRLGRARGDPSALAAALWTSGFVESEPLTAKRHYHEALRIYQGIGDHYWAALCHYFLLGIAWPSGDVGDARAHGEEGLRLSRILGGPSMIGRMLTTISRMTCGQDRLSRSWELAEEGSRYLEEASDRAHLAWVRVSQATIRRLQGEYDAARQFAQAGLALGVEAGDRTEIAAAEGELAMIASAQGDFDLARRHLAASFAQRPEGAFPHRDSRPCLALIVRAEGKHEEARQRLTVGLEAQRERGDRIGEAACLANLGVVTLDEGGLEEAEGYFRESLGLRREMGDQGGVAMLLESFGGLAALRDQPERALRLAGAGARIREAIGNVAPPVWRKQRDPWLERARQALDPVRADAAWAQGQTMTLEQAVEYARGSADGPEA